MTERDQQQRALITNEFRQFFLHTRSLHLVPLIFAGVMLVLWPYFSSPFVAVMIVLFAGLEPQFNNILFRSPREVEAMSLLPIDWERVVKAKNIGTLLITATIFPLVAAAVLYFSPKPVTLKLAVDALLWMLTVAFPLIHVGNVRSVQHPRRETGWQVDDLAGAVEFLISLGLLSLPFLIIAGFFETPLPSLLYAAATFIFWGRYSIAKTAELIEKKRIDICLNQ